MLRNIGHKKYKIYTLAFGYHNDDALLEEFESSSFVKTSIWDWCLLDEEEMFEDELEVKVHPESIKIDNGNNINFFIYILLSFNRCMKI